MTEDCFLTVGGHTSHDYMPGTVSTTSHCQNCRFLKAEDNDLFTYLFVLVLMTEARASNLFLHWVILPFPWKAVDELGTRHTK